MSRLAVRCSCCPRSKASADPLALLGAGWAFRDGRAVCPTCRRRALSWWRSPTHTPSPAPDDGMMGCIPSPAPSPAAAAMLVQGDLWAAAG